MKKTLTIGISALLLLSSCSSSQQVAGVFTGASLGGIFGSAIGGLMNGPRGSDAGTALGMIIGGAAGAAATAPRSNQESTTERDEYGQTPYSSYDNTYKNSARREQYSRENQDQYYTYRPSQIEGLQIENIRFIDDSHDQVLQPGERGKIIFNIYNRGTQTLYNITPCISVDKKQISISPSAIVSSLQPGKGCTYTASILTSPRLRNGNASFVISFQDGNKQTTFKTFEIATRRK